MHPYDLLYGTEFEKNPAVKSSGVTGISTDTEKLLPGEMFICLRGLKTDSHLLVKKALQNGAGIIVAEAGERETIRNILGNETDKTVIFAGDTRSALAFAEYNFYGRPDKGLDITAVTGTNGKTTTVSLLGSVYDAAGISNAQIGTLTGNMTTPDPHELYKTLADMRRNGVKKVFMEASSHALALKKLAPLKFRQGIFTNLTPEHLDFHSDMEDYFRAKLSLFGMCERAVINTDGEYGKRAAALLADKAVTFGRKEKSPEADYQAIFVSETFGCGFGYSLLFRNHLLKIISPMCGAFQIENTLAAASSAIEDGVRFDAIRAGIMNFRGAKGRLERVELPTDRFSVYIDFAHTPDALENILHTARNMVHGNGRLVVLFGCGGDRDRYKRRLMGQIASRLADYVIVTSDNSRSEEPEDIINGILGGIDKERPFTVEPDREKAITDAVKNAYDNDLILLCGKGHEQYEITRDGKHPFSETEIVKRAAGK